jgi:hypothetical protein
VRALGFELKKEEIKSIFEDLDKVSTVHQACMLDVACDAALR